MHEDCAIGPFVIIEAGARIGRNCQIGAGAVIGAGVDLGEDCLIGPQVTLSHCLIGARVVLHPGVRIGQAGFGFAPGSDAPVKVPQLGRVLIGDDVDIGANTTIDRGSGHDTVIGPGTMIDNLVQIGHNVVIGRFCVNVLAEGQDAVSQSFARSGGDKFAGVRWSPSAHGSPVLDDVVAWIDGELWAEYDGGDHSIVVARVLDLGAEPDRRPLLFHRGSYGLLHRGGE